MLVHLKSCVLAAGLADNVLSDYLWARAVLLIGELSCSNPNALTASAVALNAALLQTQDPGVKCSFEFQNHGELSGLLA